VLSHVDTWTVCNSMYPNLKVKDAIVDRISRKTGSRPQSGPDRSGVVVNLFWKLDKAWVYLNTSGVKLSDRSYRKMPHKAPLRESLAAGMMMATGYDGSQNLVLPMCGSGTLAIEYRWAGDRGGQAKRADRGRRSFDGVRRVRFCRHGGTGWSRDRCNESGVRASARRIAGASEQV